MIIVTFGASPAKVEIQAKQGERLSAALWLSGKIAPQPLCNGMGRCGRCKARFLENAPAPTPAEDKYFSSRELSHGWRLTCHHQVPDTACILLELPSEMAPRGTNTVLKSCEAGFLGIDFGTTSIQWQANNAQGTELAQGQLWNPQAGAGADVVSRIQYSLTPHGLRTLATLGRNAILDILQQLTEQHIPVPSLCIAANSAMTEILLEKSPNGLAASPYTLSFQGGCKANLPGTDIFILWPPLPAPFIGGDISAGILALEARHTPKPFLLLDLGTNGELALLTPERKLYLASVPMGPALEGIGPACGQPAGEGVITGFSLSPAGLTPHVVGTPVKGISATGYISLLAILARVGIMDQRGQLAIPPMPLGRKIAAGLANGRLRLPSEQFLEANDIELLLKVKAALNMAINSILQAAKLSPDEIETICLAGNLGQHMDPNDLFTLGLFPVAWQNKLMPVGNTSLQGACILARFPDMLSDILPLCHNAIILNLADDPNFLTDFINYMVWDYGQPSC